MQYTMHEMNVLLFSKEDTVFGDDVSLISGDDNEWEDSEGGYDDSDKPVEEVDW